MCVFVYVRVYIYMYVYNIFLVLFLVPSVHMNFVFLLLLCILVQRYRDIVCPTCTLAMQSRYRPKNTCLCGLKVEHVKSTASRRTGQQ